MECAAYGGCTDGLACFCFPKVSNFVQAKPTIASCHQHLEVIGCGGAEGTRSSRTLPRGSCASLGISFQRVRDCCQSASNSPVNFSIGIPALTAKKDRASLGGSQLFNFYHYKKKNLWNRLQKKFVTSVLFKINAQFFYKRVHKQTVDHAICKK